MAEEEVKENEEPTEGEESSEDGGKSKGPMKLIGGLVGVIVLGAAAAFMAIPGKEETPRFAGPYSYEVITKDNKISANVLDNAQSRYLQFELTCEYFAYQPTYLDTRITDPLYKPSLMSEINALVAKKRLSEAYVGEAREAFMAEMKDLLNPILFPIHYGKTALPQDVDEMSGIRPGISYHKATFRGRFHGHTLKVDAIEKTLQFGDDSAVSFDGGEEDYRLLTPGGETLFLDLTELKPDFQGEINVGIRGRIRRLYTPEFIAQ